MALRVMAVSAPGKLRGLHGKHALDSKDPASLYNACRYAGSLATDGIGSWGESNWVGSRSDRQKSFLLMSSFEEDVLVFKEMLKKIQPNLLLIGAMTICLPGAILCAKVAREILGNKVCIVLGGRHVSESIYLNQDGLVSHHTSSPLLLMANRRIDKLFDLVVSGEGEHIIAWIGEIVDNLDNREISLSRVIEHTGNIGSVPGNWIIGSIVNNQLYTIVSSGIQVDKNSLPFSSEIFGIHSSFDVFKGRMTAHVFSDISCGCVFDCDFCSERRSVTGPIAQLDTSSRRLFRQLQSVAMVVSEDYPGKKASAFIEDSTMLVGSTNSLNQFIKLLNDTKVDIRFGAQFTIDQIFNRVEILRKLKKVGLEYLFIGIETFNPNKIGGMSKDTQKIDGEWINRAEKAISLLGDLKIKCGAAILFGLGEDHQDRINLFEKIADWRTKYKAPSPISINWAVQHPLRGNDGGMNYSYLDWGIPSDEWLNIFADFGEASVLYPIVGQKSPIYEEVEDVIKLYKKLVSNEM